MSIETSVRKFMFVNSGSGKRSSNQSEVFSHIRLNYHQCRRTKNIERLRGMAIVSRETSGYKLPLPPSSQKPECGIGRHPFASTSDEGERRRSQPLPSVIVHEGNSDPFSAYPVKIDAETNAIIAFYREYVLPAQYHVPSKQWVSSANARLDWSICISTLEHPDLAGAFIARAATVAAVLDSKLRPLAVRHRLRNIQRLRVKLLNREDIGWSDTNILQIIMLQKAEIVERNLVAATAHARVLQHLFQERKRRVGMVDFTLLQYALWSDSQISTMFMAPLTFEVDPTGWIAQTLQPLWCVALSQLELIPQWLSLRDHADAGLDPSVKGIQLRSFFLSRRTTLQTWLYFGLQGVQVPTVVMLWLATTATLQQGRMIKYYLQTLNQVNDQAHRSEKCGDEVLNQDYWYAQQYLILAEFLWTHHLSYKVEICGIDIFDVVPTLLTRLREALEHNHEASQYRNARLYALFIGSHTEHLAADAREKRTKVDFHKQGDGLYTLANELSSGQDERWFRTRLARHIRDMDLTSWPDIFTILDRFNYADVIYPLGEDLLADVLP